MDQDFFTNLPSEITINILSRLPIRTIIRCKCVCKPWLDLLETDEFAKSHLSRSVPGLVVPGCNVFELNDELDLERHELRYTPVAEFDHTPFISHPHSHPSIQGSANGLLLLWDVSSNNPDSSLYVCNPITREYIELHSHQELVKTKITYGFGVSKITGQHKVVSISHERKDDQRKNEKQLIKKPECRVYTLGTQSSWRSTASGAALDYSCLTFGVFLNGNLHWLVSDLEGCRWISCFDLETERFSSLLPAPPRSDSLFGLRDCLCVTDYSSQDEVAFWFMKEYGVEKSWTNEFVISRNPYPIFEPYEAVYPIKFFKNGDVLMVSCTVCPLYSGGWSGIQGVEKQREKMTMSVATTLSALIVKHEMDTDANAAKASQATPMLEKDVKISTSVQTRKATIVE
ncbi:hypothetical protein C2S52_012535 [Perilla frutescens var. hirtella]|nr:hypothetical protein C2S52_012535 [Perilla frutescens var. hirtella]